MRLTPLLTARPRVLALVALGMTLLSATGCKGKHKAEAQELATRLCLDAAHEQLSKKPFLMAQVAELQSLYERAAQDQAAGPPGGAGTSAALLADLKQLKTLPYYGDEVDQQIIGILFDEAVTGRHVSVEERKKQVMAVLAGTPWWKNGCERDLPAILEECADEHGFQTPAFRTCADPARLARAANKWSPFFSKFDELKQRMRGADKSPPQ